MTTRTSFQPLLLELYEAGVAAVNPERAVRHALAGCARPAADVHLIALGKAAVPMARAAVGILAELRVEPAGGIVVTAVAAQPPHRRMALCVGDHPVPGARSLAAAIALGKSVAHVRPGDECWILLSGGTTSLVAAPIDGISPDSLAGIFGLLHARGLDISSMNGVRKRFLRWGAGRLATALGHAKVRVLAVSDVPGDNPASIGSGPCSADVLTAGDVYARLVSSDLLERFPADARRHLAGLIGNSAADTVKPGDPRVANVRYEVIARNGDAVAGARALARSRGYYVLVEGLSGEAGSAGKMVAQRLLGGAASPSPCCLIYGGETTVSLGETHGNGGRCQELALAAAHALDGQSAALLAAGTDGRDGPTDAAGAVVDGQTWRRIVDAGNDPAAALERHDSYAVLDSVGALIRRGATDTNVMDLVIAVRD